jgi:hypothetical protein
LCVALRDKNKLMVSWGRMKKEGVRNVKMEKILKGGT